MREIDRIAIPSAILVAGFVALCLPMLRSRRRTGRSGFAFHRTRDPRERLVGIVFALAHAGVAVFASVLALRGNGALGVRSIPPALIVLGWTLMATGLGLVVLAQAQMGASWRIGIDSEPTALVTRGVYRLVRNPIYAGMAAMLIGLVLVVPCVWSALVALVAMLGIGAQARLEERHLIALHGATFRTYAARVGRFLPGVGRLRAD